MDKHYEVQDDVDDSGMYKVVHITSKTKLIGYADKKADAERIAFALNEVEGL